MKNIIKCPICGAKENFSLYSSSSCVLVETAMADGVCVKCAYWTNLINNPIRDGCLLKDAYYLIFDCDSLVVGKIEWVVNLVTHEVKQAKLVKVGSPPLLVIKDIKLKFKTIHFAIARDILENRCLSVGCFDRYACARYNLQKEKKPFNKMPKNYSIGSERCSNFINIYAHAR